MNRLTLPIGQTDFRTIRTAGSYYIDKTDNIGRIIRDGAVSILFTRPRRFGKTTFQSMLRTFFDIRENSRDIFSGLAVMDDDEAVNGWMNKHPVICLTFKDIDGRSFDNAVYMLTIVLSELYQSYGFIKARSEKETEIFSNICNGIISMDDARNSLRLLSKLLYEHYGKKVIILLDEYDTPMQEAYRTERAASGGMM